MINGYHIVKEPSIDDLIQSVLYEMDMDENGRQYEPLGGLVVLPDGFLAQALMAYSKNNADSELLEEIDRLKAEKAELLEALDEVMASHPGILATSESARWHLQAVKRAGEVAWKARGEK